jgi:hypothetical protein
LNQGYCGSWAEFENYYLKPAERERNTPKPPPPPKPKPKPKPTAQPHPNKDKKYTPIHVHKSRIMRVLRQNGQTDLETIAEMVKIKYDRAKEVCKVLADEGRIKFIKKSYRYHYYIEK